MNRLQDAKEINEFANTLTREEIKEILMSRISGDEYWFCIEEEYYSRIKNERARS